MTMKDRIVSSCGKSSRNTPSADENTFGLREIALMSSYRTIAQKPLAFWRPGASGSGGRCHDTGSLSRSHRNARSRSPYGRAQNSRELRSMSTFDAGKQERDRRPLRKWRAVFRLAPSCDRFEARDRVGRESETIHPRRASRPSLLAAAPAPAWLALCDTGMKRRSAIYDRQVQKEPR